MLRKLIVRFFPNLAAKIEADSRRWMIHCKHCGFEQSVWDAGGIRYKARGTVWRYGKCANCGKSGMLKVYLPNGETESE
ncbi:MAG: hypothetical protein QNI99_05230 [Woeseiaceae bacterium]|nr:hypothetical protein [Woeseiaceae bacterium]